MITSFSANVDTRQQGEQNRHRSYAAIMALGVLSVTFALTGCTKHPQVSFANQKYAAALRTACSSKDTDQLTQVKQLIEQDHVAGVIGAQEVEAYRSIVAKAEAGEWEEAERDCHQFQKDQLAK